MDHQVTPPIAGLSDRQSGLGRVAGGCVFLRAAPAACHPSPGAPAGSCAPKMPHNGEREAGRRPTVRLQAAERRRSVHPRSDTGVPWRRQGQQGRGRSRQVTSRLTERTTAESSARVSDTTASGVSDKVCGIRKVSEVIRGHGGRLTSRRSAKVSRERPFTARLAGLRSQIHNRSRSVRPPLGA